MRILVQKGAILEKVLRLDFQLYFWQESKEAISLTFHWKLYMEGICVHSWAA